MKTHEHQQARLGLLYGLAAYGLWGIIPLYFWSIRHLPPIEILAHRIIWSFLVLLVVLSISRGWRDVAAALRSRRVMLCLAASTLLIATNWFTYIYSVKVGKVLESSLGYFMTPLVNVLLGIVFLRERLNALQVASLGLAAIGATIFGSQGKDFPWIALVLAFSFSFYGLLRKTVNASAMTGLYIETLLLSPLAVGLLAVLHSRGEAQSLSASRLTWTLLILGGCVTTGPLLFFAGAVRRLQLSTLGFLQYSSPTLQFLLAVSFFGEKLTRIKLVSFAFIWVAVMIFVVDSLRTYRQQTEDVMYD